MQALWNIAVQHHRAGRLEQAEKSYRQLQQQLPDNVQLLQALARICYEQNKPAESIGFLQKACRLTPEDADIRYSLAAILALAGRKQEAVEQYRIILQRHPDHGPTLVGMGIVYFHQLDYSAAIKCFEKAIATNSSDAEAHYNLGLARMRTGQSRKADTCFRKALAGNPEFSEARTCQLFNLHNMPDITDRQLFEAHSNWARQYTGLTTAGAGLLPHCEDISNRRIRVGYVSPDFRRHSVAFFIMPVLETHDRNKVECFCYSSVSQPDTVTEQIRSLADHWRDISTLDDEQAAELIRQDRIDILVDLSGHTSGTRLPVFARKPAPVQVTWMGYPGTTGLPAIDYRITDARADPEALSDKYYTEKLLRMESCFLCYQPLDDAQLADTPPVEKNGYITFGSFNNLAKFTTETIALWSGILNKVPDARLLLKAMGLGDEAGRESVFSAFLSNGISPDRIEYAGHIRDARNHLELYNRIDIALDTFPYNGTTTTCEALWMGVPVITLAGQRHASRVGVSLLTAAGLPELVADSSAAYVSLATRLAQSAETLKHRRRDLREKLRASSLMDKTCMVDNLEQTYRKILHNSIREPRK